MKLYALYNHKEEIVAVGTITEIAASYGLSISILRHYASKRHKGTTFKMYVIESEED